MSSRKTPSRREPNFPRLIRNGDGRQHFSPRDRREARRRCHRCRLPRTSTSSYPGVDRIANRSIRDRFDAFGPDHPPALYKDPGSNHDTFALIYTVVGLVLLLGSSGVSADTPKGEPVEAGTLPTDAGGRPLNLDFETGTLADWTAEGDAFRGQPIEGDTVHRRRGDMSSRHAGRFWVGTYEVGGDRPQGHA